MNATQEVILAALAKYTATEITENAMTITMKVLLTKEITLEEWAAYNTSIRLGNALIEAMDTRSITPLHSITRLPLSLTAGEFLTAIFLADGP